MKITTNTISSITLKEQGFDVENFKPGRMYVSQISEDGILKYYSEYKSRKRQDVIKVSVDKTEVETFFKEIYEFVRTADSRGSLIDDCSHEVVIFYNGNHKEFFEGDTYKGEESLLGKINCFIYSHA